MSTFLEIVELESGDIVLQRSGGSDEPFLTISFSKEAKGYLPEGRIELAKAMIQAGIEAASELQAQYLEESEQDDVSGDIEYSAEVDIGESAVPDYSDDKPRVLH